MSFRKMLAPLAVLAALFGVAACSDGYDSPVGPINPAPAVKTIYTASASLSDYTQRVVKSLGHAKAAASAVPDLFVINGSDLAALTGDSLKKFFETSLKGGTVLVDAPTSAQVTAFKSNADALFASDSVLKGRVEQGANTFYEVVKQFDSAVADSVSNTQQNFEAISIRGNQIYYVHDIDETLTPETPAVTPKKADRSGSSTRQTEEPVNASWTPLKTPTADWEEATKNSVANFSSWLNGSGASLLASRSVDTSAVKGLSANAAASLKADPMQAQTFIHNFTATFNYSYEHYDGRYNGKNENVEVIIDVWAACEIDKATDYYLVRTSAVCNNQQLGFKNDWDDAKHVGPYFDHCNVASTINVASGQVTKRTNDCSPQNAAGSATFTTGSSFSIGGNVGFCPTGPTGGVSVGYSESQSTSRSIPDISVNFGGSDPANGATWAYTTPELSPHWSGFYTRCANPKEIQRNAAVFDTYGLYTLPAASAKPADSDTIQLKTDVSVGLKAIAGWLETFYELDWYWFLCNTNLHYYDYVKKPCNAFDEYIMSFEPPEGVKPAEADRLHGIVKEYISDWNSNERYYAVAQSRLDGVAKGYFGSVRKKIEDNKNVFQGRGFKGTFKFYIQKVSGGSGYLDSFDLTF